ncbi:glycoside hydrolase family 65 protein [bacterium]|nr:MAG: glycoside hydrolase family 65 protein [bacterium]
MRRVAVLVVLAALAGCNRGSAPAASKVAPPAPIDPWVLATLDGRGGEPAYLSNGLIGVRIGRNGSGLDPTGKPLGFFMIDEYEPSGEEKIRSLPNPLLVTWALGNKTFEGGNNYDFLKSGGTPLDPRGGTDYRQSLDMRTGTLVTEWKQADATIRCETAVHPTQRALGQRWTVTSDKETTFSIRTLDYAGETDPQKAIGQDDKAGVAITASPRRVVALKWKLEGGEPGATMALEGFRVYEGKLKSGTTVTFERTVAFGSLATKPIKTEDIAAVQKAAPKALAYDEVASSATAAWKKRWKSDIEIDGPMEDQQAIRSFLYYLRSSIALGARRAIAPMALSSDVYFGHVFWDADIWVFPALMLTDPDLAREISEYRLDKAGQAMDNAFAWERENRPTGKGTLGPVVHDPRAKEIAAIKFPWESSITGKETVPGPSRFEDHITGSVLWGLSQAQTLGMVTMIPDAAAAQFYQARSFTKGPNGYEIKGTMSPDENHTGDNDLYTNLLAMWLTNGRKWPPQPTYKLPKDDKSFLTYDNDPVKGYKQAAAVLACYPLQYPPAEAQTRTMLERFAPKTNPNGPAMTDSIHGLLWARIGEPQKGYEEWRKGWYDFTRHPLMMFSEKRRSARTYFATGAGGSLQTVLYGFAGLRLDYNKAKDAAWSRPLAGGKMLSVKPSLPPNWKRVRLRGISLPDGVFTFDIEPGKVSVVKEAQR